jgi:hypothetical protein
MRDDTFLHLALATLADDMEAPPSTCAPQILTRLRERIRRSTRSARRRGALRRTRRDWREARGDVFR